MENRVLRAYLPLGEWAACEVNPCGPSIQLTRAGGMLRLLSSLPTGSVLPVQGPSGVTLAALAFYQGFRLSKRTNVYIDGFNLYYRALKSTPYKWLNLRLLVEQILDSSNDVAYIKYYTAMVSGHVDHDQPKRQQIYLNALSTIRGFSVYKGNFLSKVAKRPLVKPLQDGTRYVEVREFEEKGSDVNLAVHLVNDGWKDEFDVAVVISKDTDLVEPIRIVSKELKKPVGIICPDNSLPPPLGAVVSFRRYIRNQHLRAAQFPDPIILPDGTIIAKPTSW